MKRHLPIIWLAAALPSLSFAVGNLENPVAGGTESGIGVISGWHCTSTNITVLIDGQNIGRAGSGTSRGDTASICGRSDTGYSLLINYNALNLGSHTLQVFADGQLQATRQFNTVQSAGAEFVTGLQVVATLANFPTAGRTATLEWVQAKQSFVITGLTGGASPVDLSSLHGTFNTESAFTVTGSGCGQYGWFNGAQASVQRNYEIATNGSNASLTYPGCAANLTYVAGNSTSGFDLSGPLSCQGGLSGTMTTSGLRARFNVNGLMTWSLVANNITESFPGCTFTHQGFEPVPPPAPPVVDLSSLQGTYNNQEYAWTRSGSCGSSSGTDNTNNWTIATNGADATLAFPGCVSNLTYVSGSSTSGGFNLSGTLSCQGVSGTTTTTNLRRIAGQLSGTITDVFDGCTLRKDFFATIQ